MTPVNKDIERLIVRRLDGALTEDEELCLNRELIRNPQARQLLEDYERVDALASAALIDVLGGEQEDVDIAMLTERTPPRTWRARYHRGWWLVPGAVAAALLALAVPRLPFERNEPARPSIKQPLLTDGTPMNRIDPVSAVQPRMGQVGSRPIHGRGGDSLNRNVSQLPTTKRRTGRDVLGVMGDDGNVYWIETDRTRTIRQAPVRRPLGSNGEL